ncbi:sugar O-acetyltransferase [Peloplasma aerotolerans]|uniref:Acetyltransferase n=1 Tax=Peloplasma aerotolerans TaxID=3044389 RepID=A0AAW6U7W5_9MOLU|nr:sugar O-acetyltransferase [Mariniplasma sp. M4Ah]MDI6452577.1 sugar O-acetyltransferase [Mariniplasma sp. M4Ah]
MTEKEKMLSGKLYLASDEELRQMRQNARSILDVFNASKFSDTIKRRDLIFQLFGQVGQNVKVNKPFYCDYGVNIHVGDNFYANYDCMIIDVGEVKIGHNVFFGPRVNIYTAGHPIDKDVRNTQLEYGKTVTIGDDVWIGGNVVINPGVTIGSNVVIGSGSVVVKDIESNVVAAGNPCKVVRKITEKDKKFWEQEQNKH